MVQDTFQTITTAAKKFFSGTLLSRLTGLGREVAMAAAFGTAPAVAAFWMAFRFASLLRRLFGEGGLHVAFIPHFESLRKESPAKGALFFHQLGMGLTILLLFLTLSVEGILGSLLLWGHLEPGTIEILRLTMILLPALIFICLFALNQSLLNCEHSYFIPSVAPAFLNLIWIGTVIWLWKTPAPLAMEKLAMAIVFAFGGQWLVTVPQVYRYLAKDLGPKWWEAKRKIGREVLGILRPFLLSLVGVAATQINNALDAIFARAADPEGPAILWYALRLQQLPLALLGVGLTGALLPPISRAIQSGDRSQYLQFLGFALQKAVTFMVPLTVAMVVLGFAGVNMVYGHGEFSQKATIATTQCLWAYGAGLLPMTLVLILASAFYAQKNYRLPTLFAVLSVGVNICLNALFVFVLNMGALSIAVATSIASCFNFLLLFVALAKSQGIPIKPLVDSLWKITLCSCFAGGMTVLISGFFFHDPLLPLLKGAELTPFVRALPSQVMLFCVEAFCFGSFFLGVAYLMKIGVNLKSKRMV